MTTTQNRCSSVSSAVVKRQAMVANSSGLGNNQAEKLNAGAAMKRPAIYNILDSYNFIYAKPYLQVHAPKIIGGKKCTVSSWGTWNGRDYPGSGTN
ncbi:hypothetical protein MTR67_003928 [Solanum verrucosum]|uniref:Uncharacterized protein n=1 Tax=Solanum verrucosum TaxID=315347 RepID=A0AAF0PT45_SOLVR|nr:hypothetical protein MTR67_003928 [Solanum verrucosum]